ncbi:MAG TPA: hypothetical protein DCX07_09865 [Phycisphaerales bacterium]|nr:hypothetical protein [Phycisphaerales bacterium]
MSFKTLFGYVLVVVCGLLILAAALLVVLQWQLRADFNLFGKPLSIRVVQESGKLVGGVNTGLLMLLSAAGGIVMVWVVKLLVRGLKDIRKGGQLAREVEREVHRLAAGTDKDS